MDDHLDELVNGGGGGESPQMSAGKSPSVVQAVTDSATRYIAEPVASFYEKVVGFFRQSMYYVYALLLTIAISLIALASIRPTFVYSTTRDPTTGVETTEFSWSKYILCSLGMGVLCILLGVGMKLMHSTFFSNN